MMVIQLLYCFCSALSKFVNKAADGGITALHMAALNGYFDCIQLLLDIHASVSSVTFHYGTSMDLIGWLLASYCMTHPFFPFFCVRVCFVLTKSIFEFEQI